MLVFFNTGENFNLAKVLCYVIDFTEDNNAKSFN